MKKYIRVKSFFLILFLLLFLKKPFLKLITPLDSINYENAYISTLEEDIKSSNVIKSRNFLDDFIYGKVLYENPYQKGIIHLYVDNSNNISLNDYVIGENGFLGLVSGINKNEIRFKDYTNDDFIIQVNIGSCTGILKKDILDNIDSSCKVFLGDKVTTSPLGYHKEIFDVGYITKEIKSDGENSKYQIKMTNDRSKYNYAVVITKRGK